MGRHLLRFVVAHAVAVGSGSVALAVTALVLVVLDRGGVDTGQLGSARAPLVALGGALFIVFFAVVGGSILALPASLAAYPLALLAVRRGWCGRRLVALGGAAGLLIGLPLLMLTLSADDLPRLWADLPRAAWEAAGSFGPAAAAAGAGFAWVVGRTRG